MARCYADIGTAARCVHRPSRPVMGDAGAVVLDLPIEQLQPGFGHHLRATLPRSAGIRIRHAAAVSACDGRRTSARSRLQHDDAFLSAALGTGRRHLVVPGAPAAGRRSCRCRRLTSTHCDDPGRSWLVRSSGELVERPTLGALFHLHVGDLAVDLRYQLPFDLANWPNRLTLLRDGWRIEQICRYQPLVYYSAFGSPDHHEQFAVSVRSLIEFGRYQGPILSLTDQTPAGNGGDAAPEDLARVAVHAVQADDGPASWRRAISSLTGRMAGQFQPVALRRCRHVFDGDVAPMLRTVATSDHIAAPFEPTRRMAETAVPEPRCCSGIICSPGFMAGFNTGTLGIPNLRAHAETLRLIRRIIANHSIMHGRATLP